MLNGIRFLEDGVALSNGDKAVLVSHEDFFGAISEMGSGEKDAPPAGDPVEATSALLEAFRTSVNVKIKTPKQYDIEIDFDNLTFEHMQLIEKMQGGDLSADEQQSALKEVLFILTGLDVSTLPLRVTASILQEFKAGMQGMTSPNV